MTERLSLSLYMAEGARKFLCVLFYKGTNSSHEGSTFKA